MMMSEENYFEEIKNYSYAELLSEEKRLFKYIIELQYKIVLEETHLDKEAISPSYKMRLEAYRRYLIVLQNYILEKERELKELEVKELLSNAFERKEV